MDLAHLFCPNRDCPARGQTGQGNLGLHSRTEPRLICQQCHKPCTGRKGTAFSRLRTPAETVSRVRPLVAQGCPVPAIVVACGFAERRVAAWFARAGRQAPAVQAHWVEQPRGLGQGQADEIRVKPQGTISWLALALSVGPRLGLAGEVSEQRHLGVVRPLLGRVRRGAARGPRWLCTAGFRAYPRAIRDTFRDRLPTGKPGRPRWRRWNTLPMAQVAKPYVPRRVVRVERRILVGTAAPGAQLRRRAQGGTGVINTAYLARPNATCREHLATLTRRGRALARRTRTRHAGRELIGTVYNCCPSHTSLSNSGPGALAPCTPAMAATLTEHRWTVQELLSFQVPLPPWTPPKRRGRPSRALQCLVERWCS
jgi:transposase-like protein